MRPEFDRVFAAHGWPLWLVPDYFVLVALGSVIGAAIAHRLARRDGADAAAQSRALAVAYLCALLGGYVFEWIRAVPAALAADSLQPIAMSGRAAYGGLLGGMLGAAVYLRRARVPLGAFFDRVSVGTGIVFVFVRTGCFLEGCDYGRVTASGLGVRFPAGSLAAIDHASHGWIREGAASLPVHPTELYEAAVGALASLIAAFVLRRRRRNGEGFAAWLVVYAIGRFATECLRGDIERGVYLARSSAQWVSLAIVLAVIVWHTRVSDRATPRRPLAIALAALVGVAFVSRDAHAQTRRHDHDAVTTSASASVTASSAPSGSPNGSAWVRPPPQQPATATPAPFYVSLDTIVSFPLTQIAPGYIAIQPPQGIPTPPLAPGYVLAAPIPPPGYAPLQPGPGVVLVQPIYTAGTPRAATPAPQPLAAPPVDDGVDATGATPGVTETTTPPPESPQRTARVTTRATFFGSFNFSRGSVPWGTGAEIAGAYRLRFARHARFEAGLEGGFQRTGIATHWMLGVWLGLIGEVGSVFEMGAVVVPQVTWIVFDSPFYAGTNAFGARAEFVMQFALGSHVFLGFSPLAGSFMNSESIGTVFAYQPRLWLGAVF
jgi:prolipoprotein diacylglyceryltransferase